MTRQTSPEITVIGGGLAGAEAAWQAARFGVRVKLYEMRPRVMTPAHRTGLLAELVCSNSLGSLLPDRATGMLLEELRILQSLLLRCAEKHRVPAGQALAVDRTAFAEEVTRIIEQHPNIRLVREMVADLPEGITVIAAGPLAAQPLMQKLAEVVGVDYLYFYDAVAPLVAADTIDLSCAFHASRYGHGGAEDYLNCPLTETEYRHFVEALLSAERAPLREFEAELESGVKAGHGPFFERCLPIEVMARRGWLTLAHGPMRPTGLTDPRTGRRPFAVLQLRRDNAAGDVYNLVGMQTNLKYREQERIFRMIPALRQARFLRYGQMHRNTFICAPQVLQPTLQSRSQPRIFFAGQITGIEGYAGNIASGLVAGINAALLARGVLPRVWPRESMCGALCHYITNADPATFQPMKANFALLPDERPGQIPTALRRQQLVARGLEAVRRLAENLCEMGTE